MTTETRQESGAAPAGGLRVRGLNHFTLPVRDRFVAGRFYTAIFDAEVHHESDPDRVKMGKANSLQLGVRLCDGLEIDLFEQSFGQPTEEQSHPHHAFDAAPEDMLRWVERLEYWQVPHVGPITRSGTRGAELYFTDPDGNKLEINCSNYPDELRSQLPMGPFSQKDTVIRQWPTPEREAQATQQFEEKLARMRAAGRQIS